MGILYGDNVYSPNPLLFPITNARASAENPAQM
jgi:hypothetical protein